MLSNPIYCLNWELIYNTMLKKENLESWYIDCIICSNIQDQLNFLQIKENETSRPAFLMIVKSP